MITLTDLCVSRELAERMKSLGFEQDSLFSWCPGQMEYGYEGEWNIDVSDDKRDKFFLFDHVVSHSFQEYDVKDLDEEWLEGCPKNEYNEFISEDSEEYKKWEKEYIKGEKRNKDRRQKILDSICSAPTAGEIELPITMIDNSGDYPCKAYLDCYRIEDGTWECGYDGNDFVKGRTEAEAKGLMWCYLKENKLI